MPNKSGKWSPQQRAAFARTMAAKRRGEGAIRSAPIATRASHTSPEMVHVLENGRLIPYEAQQVTVLVRSRRGK